MATPWYEMVKVMVNPNTPYTGNPLAGDTQALIPVPQTDRERQFAAMFGRKLAPDVFEIAPIVVAAGRLTEMLAHLREVFPDVWYEPRLEFSWTDGRYRFVINQHRFLLPLAEEVAPLQERYQAAMEA